MTSNIAEGDTLTVRSIVQKGTLRSPVEVGTEMTATSVLSDGRIMFTEYHEENDSLPVNQVTGYEGDGNTLKLGGKNAVNFHQIVEVKG